MIPPFLTHISDKQPVKYTFFKPVNNFKCLINPGAKTKFVLFLVNVNASSSYSFNSSINSGSFVPFTQ